MLEDGLVQGGVSDAGVLPDEVEICQKDVGFCFLQSVEVGSEAVHGVLHGTVPVGGGIHECPADGYRETVYSFPWLQVFKAVERFDVNQVVGFVRAGLRLAIDADLKRTFEYEEPDNQVGNWFERFLGRPNAVGRPDFGLESPLLDVFFSKQAAEIV